MRSRLEATRLASTASTASPAFSNEGEAAAFVYDSPDEVEEAASVLGWEGNSRVRGNVLLVVDPGVRLEPLAQDTIIDCLGSEDALEADTSDEEPGPPPAEIAQCLRDAGQKVEEAGVQPFTGGGGIAAAERLSVQFLPESAEIGTLPMNIYVPASRTSPRTSPV